MKRTYSICKRGIRDDGFCVSPKSAADIRFWAERIRKMFFPHGHKFIDIAKLIDCEMPVAYENFNCEIVTDDELPGREAEFDPFAFCIRIRESVYLGACEMDGHCRFTLAHELGHLFLHRDQTLAFGFPIRGGEIPYYRNSEWQADTFARNLLVPVEMARGMTVDAISMCLRSQKEWRELSTGRHRQSLRVNHGVCLETIVATIINADFYRGWIGVFTERFSRREF